MRCCTTVRDRRRKYEPLAALSATSVPTPASGHHNGASIGFPQVSGYWPELTPYLPIPPSAMDFILSGVAACGACLFTNPLEVVKTRMQLQGELQSRGTYQVFYRNVFHAFYTIGKVDGLAALQKGLAPGLVYQFFMNGVRLGSYAVIESSGYIHTDGRVSAAKSTVAGSVAGVVGAVMGSPIYLVSGRFMLLLSDTKCPLQINKHQM